MRKFGVFPERLLALYINQILRGLSYLHHKSLIHRDIKGANILLTKDGTCKLADFGSCTHANKRLSIVGSPFWMAPEIISSSGGGSLSDIWSVGCLIIELLTGFPPYWKMGTTIALFKMVEDVHPPLPERVTPALQNFLLNCFKRDYLQRPSADDLLTHPWITSIWSSPAPMVPMMQSPASHSDSPPRVRLATFKGISQFFSSNESPARAKKSGTTASDLKRNKVDKKRTPLPSNLTATSGTGTSPEDLTSSAPSRTIEEGSESKTLKKNNFKGFFSQKKSGNSTFSSNVSTPYLKVSPSGKRNALVSEGSSSAFDPPSLPKVENLASPPASPKKEGVSFAPERTEVPQTSSSSSAISSTITTGSGLASPRTESSVSTSTSTSTSTGSFSTVSIISRAPERSPSLDLPLTSFKETIERTEKPLHLGNSPETARTSEVKLKRAKSSRNKHKSDDEVECGSRERSVSITEGRIGRKEKEKEKERERSKSRDKKKTISKSPLVNGEEDPNHGPFEKSRSLSHGNLEKEAVDVINQQTNTNRLSLSLDSTMHNKSVRFDKDNGNESTNTTANLDELPDKPLPDPLVYQGTTEDSELQVAMAAALKKEKKLRRSRTPQRSLRDKSKSPLPQKKSSHRNHSNLSPIDEEAVIQPSLTSSLPLSTDSSPRNFAKGSGSDGFKSSKETSPTNESKIEDMQQRLVDNEHQISILRDSVSYFINERISLTEKLQRVMELLSIKEGEERREILLLLEEMKILLLNNNLPIIIPET
eukprot:TRINITY_DN346_c0_g1_i2.p1 TRINITY_DN346_c0_g1~~TRINITY_DN346_c0_g1_i2.p1  ORF type:complete len:861 (-),score=215.07 TRINITY_DN346_c0_g1_i2:223-2514(-)